VSTQLKEKDEEGSKVLVDPHPQFLRGKFREVLDNVLFFGNYTDSILSHPRARNVLSPISNELSTEVFLESRIKSGSKKKEKSDFIFDIKADIVVIFTQCLVSYS
jgi:hypothetical protein